jgi:hypothetical protein
MKTSTKRAREVLDLIQNSPCDFTEKLLVNDDGTPAVPHPGQKELLEGVRRITVAACGRQWGQIIGTRLVYRLVEHSILSST